MEERNEDVGSEVQRVRWLPAMAVALASLGAHLAVAGRYGFHRDELYYIAGGLRFEPGYVDHPLLTPWIAGWTTGLLGLSLVGLRLWAALGGALSVILAAAFCARLGGGARGQLVASAATALCPFFLFSHTVYQTNLLDQLIWSAALLVLLRGAQQAPTDGRIAASSWLLFGALAALGFASKYTILMLGAAMVIALAVRRRREFSHPGLWAGGLVAMVGLAPSLWWQWHHDLPFLRFSANVEKWPPWTSVPTQALLIGIGALPLVVLGTRLLLRRSEATRLLAWTILMALVLFTLIAAKPYYGNAVYVALFGAGGAAVEAGRRRWPVWTLAANLLLLPFLMPVLPVGTYARLTDPIGELAETGGWPEFVDQVRGAIDSLPPEERDGLVVLTANYGEAGALELLWGDGDRPPVVSGHNSYAWWMEEALGDAPVLRVLGVGYSTDGRLSEHFRNRRELTRISNPWGLENQENGTPVTLATDPRGPVREWLLRQDHMD